MGMTSTAARPDASGTPAAWPAPTPSASRQSTLGLASLGSAIVSCLCTYSSFAGGGWLSLRSSLSLFTALAAVALGILGLNRNLVKDARRGAAVAGLAIGASLVATVVVFTAFVLFVVLMFAMGS
jgi:hypothetical protein